MRAPGQAAVWRRMLCAGGAEMCPRHGMGAGTTPVGSPPQVTQFMMVARGHQVNTVGLMPPLCLALGRASRNTQRGPCATRVCNAAVPRHVSVPPRVHRVLRTMYVLGGGGGALGPSRNHKSTSRTRSDGISGKKQWRNMEETNQWGGPGREVLSSDQDDTTTHSGRSLPPDGRSPRGRPLPESQGGRMLARS